jgi:hypothetical protein
VSPAHLPGDPTTPTPAPPHPLPLQRLEIVAASSVPAGAEVHNTYGELSNVELVRKYGFALSANPFDELPLAAGWEEAVGELVAAAGAGAAGGGKGKVQKAGSNAAAGHRQQQKEDTEEEEQQAAAAAVLVAAGGERQLRRRLRWLRTHRWVCRTHVLVVGKGWGGGGAGEWSCVCVALHRRWLQPCPWSHVAQCVRRDSA